MASRIYLCLDSAEQLRPNRDDGYSLETDRKDEPDISTQLSARNLNRSIYINNIVFTLRL